MTTGAVGAMPVDSCVELLLLRQALDAQSGACSIGCGAYRARQQQPDVKWSLRLLPDCVIYGAVVHGRRACAGAQSGWTGRRRRARCWRSCGGRRAAPGTATRPAPAAAAMPARARTPAPVRCRIDGTPSRGANGHVRPNTRLLRLESAFRQILTVSLEARLDSLSSFAALECPHLGLSCMNTSVGKNGQVAVQHTTITQARDGTWAESLAPAADGSGASMSSCSWRAASVTRWSMLCCGAARAKYSTMRFATVRYVSTAFPSCAA